MEAAGGLEPGGVVGGPPPHSWQTCLTGRVSAPPPPRLGNVPPTCHTRGLGSGFHIPALHRIIEVPHPAHSGSGRLEGPPGRFPCASQGAFPSPCPQAAAAAAPVGWTGLPGSCVMGIPSVVRVASPPLQGCSEEPPAVSTKAGRGAAIPDQAGEPAILLCLQLPGSLHPVSELSCPPTPLPGWPSSEC